MLHYRHKQMAATAENKRQTYKLVTGMHFDILLESTRESKTCMQAKFSYLSVKQFLQFSSNTFNSTSSFRSWSYRNHDLAALVCKLRGAAGKLCKYNLLA